MVYYDTRHLIRAVGYAETVIGAARMPHFGVGLASFIDPRTGELCRELVHNNAPGELPEGKRVEIVLVPDDGWWLDTTARGRAAKPGECFPPVGIRVPLVDPALDTAGVG